MRIAIIDDDRLVCDSLGIILGAQEDIEVVGCGCNGDDAVRLTREAAPDVLLMDIQMPGRDGLSAAREILGEGGRTRVVFLTTGWARPATSSSRTWPPSRRRCARSWPAGACSRAAPWRT